MAAGSTYTPIATTTTSGSVSQVTFSSISGSYTDLYLVCDIAYASLGANTGYVVYQVGNGSIDTNTVYSYTWLKGNGSAASSSRGSGAPYIDGLTEVTGTNRVQFKVNFQNYSNTTTFKTFLNRVDDASKSTEAVVGLWRSTAAINTIKVSDASGYNFSSNSTFTLYGIAAA
jgi:hypothetical protein